MAIARVLSRGYQAGLVHPQTMCLIIFRGKSEELKPKGPKIGKRIKELNRENKNLFGKLLETRQKRKKSLLKGKVSVNKNGSESTLQSDSAEYLWHARTAKTSAYQYFSKELTPKSEKQIFKASTLSKNEETNIGNKRISSSKLNKEDSYLNQDNSKCLGDKQSNTNMCAGGDNVSVDHGGEFVKNSDRLNLPSIVIRNMTSFAMLHRKKSALIDSNQIKDIITITENVSKSNRKESYLSYPSVTRILNATMSEKSRAALKKWKEQKIAELGEEGFLVYSKALLDHGSQFHNTIQSFLRGIPEKDLKLEPAIEGCWNSLSSVVSQISNVCVLESSVVHPQLYFRGIVDCVAYYNDQPVLIEWKKSDKPKPEIQWTYDAPVQMSAYIGALNYDPRYDFQVKDGLVVVAYSDGSPADVFYLPQGESARYWHVWLQRLQKYWLDQHQVS